MSRTVWLVQGDKRRDYSAAEEYGEIKEIFSSIHRDFDPSGAIEHARRALSRLDEDDYLVMAGDPTLCSICVTIAAEYLGGCRVLRWDKNKLRYDLINLAF